MSRPEPDLDPAWVIHAGGIKQVLVQLSEPELMLMRSWIEREIRVLAETPAALRLLRAPGQHGPGLPILQFTGTLPELMGLVRHRLHELPEDRLLMLHGWVNDLLREGYHHRG